MYITKYIYNNTKYYKLRCLIFALFSSLITRGFMTKFNISNFWSSGVLRSNKEILGLFSSLG